MCKYSNTIKLWYIWSRQSRISPCLLWLLVFLCGCFGCGCFTWLLWGIPYKASTRSAALFKITSYNQEREREKEKGKKGIDQECDGSKSSVTFITFHFLHYAVNAEQSVANRRGKEADRGRERKRNGPIPALCYQTGQFGRAEGRYCYQWIKHEPISLYQSTIFCNYSPPFCHWWIMTPVRMITHQFNLTQHIIRLTATQPPPVSGNTLVSWPVLTPVMIRVNGPASTLCDKCRTSLLRWKPPSGISHIKHLS